MDFKKWILNAVLLVSWLSASAQQDSSRLQVDVNYINQKDHFSSYVNLFPLVNREYNSIESNSDGLQAIFQYRRNDDLLTGMNLIITEGTFATNSYTYLQIMPTIAYDFQLFSGAVEVVPIVALGPEWFWQEGDGEKLYSFNIVQARYSLLTRVRLVDRLFASLGYSFSHKPFEKLRRQLRLIGSNHQAQAFTVGLSLHLF